MPDVFKKDIQYVRFSLYGFLKNQKFHDPFFMLFLLANGISYFHIGILYSIRVLIINLLEIPGGIIADSIGRRRTMIISFLFYILSFIIFYLSASYLLFAAAMVAYGIGDVFRTGTHKAMIYEYIGFKGWDNQRVSYYGHTRSWSQLGSALSSLIAAAIVIISDDYRSVFIFITVPYMINLINVATYPSWLDGDQVNFDYKLMTSRFREVIRSLVATFRKREVLKIYASSSLISGFYDSTKDYLQPLIVSLAAGITIVTGVGESDTSTVSIGIIYFIIYILTSRASKLSGRFATLAGGEFNSMNITFLLVAITGTISGLTFHLSWPALSVYFFILILLIENIRRPICVSGISSISERSALSTFLSADSQLKSFVTMIFSPLLGLLADKTNPGFAILVLSLFLALLYPFLRTGREKVHQ